ncbi:MAG: hypothetical protein ABIB12_00670 [Patescibacteria group bacterium]
MPDQQEMHERFGKLIYDVVGQVGFVKTSIPAQEGDISLQEAVEMVLRTLPHYLAEALSLRYGLTGTEPYTYSALGLLLPRKNGKSEKQATNDAAHKLYTAMDMLYHSAVQDFLELFCQNIPGEANRRIEIIRDLIRLREALQTLEKERALTFLENALWRKNATLRTLIEAQKNEELRSWKNIGSRSLELAQEIVTYAKAPA